MDKIKATKRLEQLSKIAFNGKYHAKKAKRFKKWFRDKRPTVLDTQPLNQEAKLLITKFFPELIPKDKI